MVLAPFPNHYSVARVKSRNGSSRAHPLFSKLKMNGSSRALLWEGVLFRVSGYKMDVNDQNRAQERECVMRNSEIEYNTQNTLIL